MALGKTTRGYACGFEENDKGLGVVLGKRQGVMRVGLGVVLGEWHVCVGETKVGARFGRGFGETTRIWGKNNGLVRRWVWFWGKGMFVSGETTQ